MTVKRMAIFSVPVKDQQAAKAFYVEKLGFKIIRENPMGPDQNWVQLGPVGAETSITLVTWFSNMPPGSLQGVVLDTDDVRATHANLKEKGVAVSEIEAAPWGTFFTFNDPDGNGYVMQQFTQQA